MYIIYPIEYIVFFLFLWRTLTQGVCASLETFQVYRSLFRLLFLPIFGFMSLVHRSKMAHNLTVLYSLEAFSISSPVCLFLQKFRHDQKVNQICRHLSSLPFFLNLSFFKMSPLCKPSGTLNLSFPIIIIRSAWLAISFSQVQNKFICKSFKMHY